jgi:hypothetical protein
MHMRDRAERGLPPERFSVRALPESSGITWETCGARTHGPRQKMDRSSLLELFRHEGLVCRHPLGELRELFPRQREPDFCGAGFDHDANVVFDRAIAHAQSGDANERSGRAFRLVDGRSSIERVNSRAQRVRRNLASLAWRKHEMAHGCALTGQREPNPTVRQQRVVEAVALTARRFRCSHDFTFQGFGQVTSSSRRSRLPANRHRQTMGA